MSPRIITFKMPKSLWDTYKDLVKSGRYATLGGSDSIIEREIISYIRGTVQEIPLELKGDEELIACSVIITSIKAEEIENKFREKCKSESKTPEQVLQGLIYHFVIEQKR